jgi:glycosyltransferase involved in cell wall biosynthesis
VVEYGKNGCLAKFFEVDEMAATAEKVLDSPGAFRHLGAAGVEMVRDRYSLEVCLPRMLWLYDEVCTAYRG